MNREDIYRIFGDKDLSYVFNRVIFDTTKTKARDTVVIRGSLLEEDLELSNMDGLMLEMLIGDQFVNFYQNVLSIPYDKRSQEDKLYMFSVSLYKWISERLGYIPDWVLPNREEHLTTFLNLLLVEADSYIPDSEVLLALLLRNTDFSKSKVFKEQLRRGIWSSTETGLSSLEVAEDEYLLGKTNTSVDSLSLYVRLAERGYREIDTLMMYMSNRTFRDTVVTDYEEVQKALNDFIWKYGNGERWVNYTEEVYNQITEIPLKNIYVELVNPNQIAFRDKDDREDAVVQITFSDKIEVTVRKDRLFTVAYNKEFYQASYEDINKTLDKYEFRTKNIIPVVKVLFKNLPIRIPNKEREIEMYS